MKQYDVECPNCGTVNKGLYLEETNGWMICEHCRIRGNIGLPFEALSFYDEQAFRAHRSQHINNSM